eukprot:Seg1545.2_Seg1545.9 transcript_id=Seg1545.2_Seg1545.9/GoldUCD/mRNA.D3Y31 product="putative lysosomal cobalamin transporter" protein_id=Seg1545.2_Seg1545.9/GoldUCD/D3Y31
MVVPHAVLASGWIPFVVVIVLALIFAWTYIRHYQHHELSELSTTLISILALFVTLLTTGLVPVDVFLVSYMKDSSGSYKSWASDPDARKSIEDTITLAYYALYATVAFFIFIILPFMYFYYEEKDDDVSVASRCCSALKFTCVFLLIAIVILFVGAFVPLRPPPKNMTAVGDKFNYLKDELKVYSHGEQCISIMVGVLSVFGMSLIAVYTGYGMSALPLRMIVFCKKKDGEDEDGEVRDGLNRRQRDEERARMLRAKANSGRTLTRWERNQLRKIEEAERLRRRLERQKKNAGRSCCGKISLMLRPFRVFFGIIFLLISLLIMISVIITSIDKLKHSLGYKYGYALPKPTIFNPLNVIMVYAQKVFPLDYVLFVGMVLFLLFASMTGLKRMGIWCCCVRMFKIKAYRTMPQALLLMIFIMMLMVLSINVMLFTITPQYVMFGSQHFRKNSTDGKVEAAICSTESPPDECTMTRMAVLLNKLFYKAWFFGAFYYYAQWCLIVIFVIGFVISLIKCRSEDHDDSEMDDLDSDEEPFITA